MRKDRKKRFRNITREENTEVRMVVEELTKGSKSVWEDAFREEVRFQTSRKRL